jgi:hypothetical protein
LNALLFQDICDSIIRLFEEGVFQSTDIVSSWRNDQSIYHRIASHLHMNSRNAPKYIYTLISSDRHGIKEKIMNVKKKDGDDSSSR